VEEEETEEKKEEEGAESNSINKSSKCASRAWRAIFASPRYSLAHY